MLVITKHADYDLIGKCSASKHAFYIGKDILNKEHAFTSRHRVLGHGECYDSQVLIHVQRPSRKILGILGRWEILVLRGP